MSDPTYQELYNKLLPQAQRLERERAAALRELKWQEQWLVDYFGEEDTESGEPKKALRHVRKAIAAMEANDLP